MSIRELRRGVWQVRVYAGKDPLDAGKQRQLARNVQGTKREAQAVERELRTRLRAGSLTTSDTTVDALLARWLEHIAGRGRSPWTLDVYEGYVRRYIRPALGSLRLRDLTPERLDGFYDALLGRGLAARTVRQAHAIISAALAQAVKWRAVDRNVAELASPPSIERRTPNLPTPVVLQQLIRAAEESDPNLGAVVMFAALTGARRGELCALRWSDVDWEAPAITIREAVYDGVRGMTLKDTKTHQVREIALDTVALQLLDRQATRQGDAACALGLERLPGGFIFSPSPTGDVPLLPTTLSHAWTRLVRAHGLDLHFHDLRHFSVTMSIDAGVPLPTVSARHGHSSMQTTATIYAHAIRSTDQVAAARMGALLSGGDDG